MRGLRILACVLALATTASLTIGLLQVLEVIPSEQENWIPLAIYPFLALAILSPAVVGLLIALQLPRNRIAWILLLGALLPALQIASEQLVGAAWAYQTEAATVPPVLFAWPLAVAFVFPSGRLLSRRWRWVAGMAIVSFAFTIGLKLFDPEPYPAPNEDITNPLLGNAVGEFIIDTGLWIPFAIGVLASLFAGALAVILRFRRSVGVERLQMKWLVWGASLIPLVLPLDIVMSSWFGGGGAKTFALLLVAQFAFVAAIGIAVVRYRLYAIERLVNRTLVYVTLTLLLLAVYAAITIGLGVVVGGDSAWVVALATLVVALAFRPLRARIQDLVDRRYRRARYEGVRRVRAFEDEVRDWRARARGDRSGTRGRLAGSARGALLLGDRDGRRMPIRRESGWTSFRRTSELAVRSNATTSRRPYCSTIRRCSSGGTSSTASSPRPHSRSRSLGCASRSACSSRRFRPRARASSKRATRNAGASSATCTTGPSSASSRSACKSDDSS